MLDKLDPLFLFLPEFEMTVDTCCDDKVGSAISSFDPDTLWSIQDFPQSIIQTISGVRRQPDAAKSKAGTRTPSVTHLVTVTKLTVSRCMKLL